MATYEQTVQVELERLDDNEIVDKLRSGSLTDAAAQIASSILVKRGLDVPKAAAVDQSAVRIKSGQATVVRRVWEFLRRCAGGRESLMAAYWILGAAQVLFTVALFFTYEFALSGRRVGAFVDLIGFLWVGSMVFHAVCVWRCAKNARVYAFGQLAKVYATLQIGIWLVLVPMAAITQWFASM